MDLDALAARWPALDDLRARDFRAAAAALAGRFPTREALEAAGDAEAQAAVAHLGGEVVRALAPQGPGVTPITGAWVRSLVGYIGEREAERHADALAKAYATVEDIRAAGRSAFADTLARSDLSMVLVRRTFPPDPDASDTPGMSDEARALSKQLVAAIRGACQAENSAGPALRLLEGHSDAVVTDAFNTAGSIEACTPLAAACTTGGGIVDLVRVMVARGADPHARQARSREAMELRRANYIGSPDEPIACCAANGSPEVLRVLVTSPLLDVPLTQEAIRFTHIPDESRDVLRERGVLPLPPPDPDIDY